MGTLAHSPVSAPTDILSKESWPQSLATTIHSKRSDNPQVIGPSFFHGPYSISCFQPATVAMLNDYVDVEGMFPDITFYEWNIRYDLVSLGERKRPVYTLGQTESILQVCSRCSCDQESGALVNAPALGISPRPQGCTLPQDPKICEHWMSCGCLAELYNPSRPDHGSLDDFQAALDGVGAFTKKQNPHYKWHYDPTDLGNFLKFTPLTSPLINQNSDDIVGGN
ncbi:hypothetical protein ABW19_dt0207514 [Dactylella cylindrospora]|nr:hypothetical protein ABW19_dt0207514 [Dactylella cylindrospora]